MTTYADLLAPISDLAGLRSLVMGTTVMLEAMGGGSTWRATLIRW